MCEGLRPADRRGMFEWNGTTTTTTTTTTATTTTTTNNNDNNNDTNTTTNNNDNNSDNHNQITFIKLLIQTGRCQLVAQWHYLAAVCNNY